MVDIKSLSLPERVALRDQLNGSMPGLEAVSLNHEISELFSDAKEALTDALGDPDVNSAPIINAVTALIKQMTQLQAELYNSERQRLFEEAILEVIDGFSEEIKNILLEKFEEKLL